MFIHLQTCFTLILMKGGRGGGQETGSRMGGNSTGERRGGGGGKGASQDGGNPEKLEILGKIA